MTSPLLYAFGDDDLALDRAAARLAKAVGETTGAPLERWDLRGSRNEAPRQLGELHERLATGSLFGGGTLAVVTNPGALTVRTEDRERFHAVLGLVAPGNALAIVEATASGAKEPGQKKLAEAVRAAGGELRRHDSPKEGALAAWIESEGRDRGVRMGPGAAKELAGRIGGFVREGDAERRDQTRRAAMELDKLGLYRGDALVSIDDVRALVAEAIPGSAWALTDAVGNRDVVKALGLLETVAATTPEPVIVVTLHRRIRELALACGHLATGAAPGTLVRLLGVHPYRADMLIAQARRWTEDELRRAIDGLVELDAVVKGAPGRVGGEARRRLAFSLWISDCVGRGGLGRAGAAVG